MCKQTCCPGGSSGSGVSVLVILLAVAAAGSVLAPAAVALAGLLHSLIVLAITTEALIAVGIIGLAAWRLSWLWRRSPARVRVRAEIVAHDVGPAAPPALRAVQGRVLERHDTPRERRRALPRNRSMLGSQPAGGSAHADAESHRADTRRA